MTFFGAVFQTPASDIPTQASNVNSTIETAAAGIIHHTAAADLTPIPHVLLASPAADGGDVRVGGLGVRDDEVLEQWKRAGGTWARPHHSLYPSQPHTGRGQAIASPAYAHDSQSTDGIFLANQILNHNDRLQYRMWALHADVRAQHAVRHSAPVHRYGTFRSGFVTHRWRGR